MILLIIRDILLTNPTVKVDKDNYILEENPKEPEYPYKIKGIGQTYTIYDGYKLSLKQTESGLCLIVGIKNRIKGDLSVYDALMDEDSSYGENIEESIENLIGKRFIPDGSTKSKIIYDIDVDRNPKNTTKYYESQSYDNYVDFYKKVFGEDIQDHDQPMIMVKVRGPDKEDKFIYYVPEFCKLCGIEQDDIQDYKFMNNLASYTKLDPDQKIKKIDQFLDLFKDNIVRAVKDKKEDKKEGKKENKKEEEKENKKRNKNKKKGKNKKGKTKQEDNKEEEKEEKEEKKEDNQNKNIINEETIDINNTSDKKRKYYGIEISKLKELTSYHISQPTFNNIENKEINLKSVFFVARENVSTDEWLCLYNESLNDYTYDLLDSINAFKKQLGIKIESKNSNWIPMKTDRPDQWKKKVEEIMAKRKIKFVIFFLSKSNNELYNEMKKDSLSNKGYISQVIKFESFKRAKNKNNKILASYISKILLQINCKLGGASYLLNLDKSILEREIMFIGIDFGLNASHTWKRREEGVISMVATKDKYFSKLYPQNEIIKCKKEDDYIVSLHENISNFIDKALIKYEKEENGRTPKNIIIYRQGISEYQTKFIENEIKIIEEICNKKKINYYYVLVYNKTSLKIFEQNNKKTNREQGDYKNPEPGLVLLNKVTDKNKFEFYIQPQKVTEGSATPTCFHAIYGNMNFPELLIKLSYWTAYIYPNWQNAVRIPHVLKVAEKYSYMTAKITRKRNKDNLQDSLADL